jgi:hypothetical protein
MSHKSTPGDGTRNNGVKGGGLYLRHHEESKGESVLDRIISLLVGR